MSTNTSTTDMNLARRALAAAGIEAIEVDHCVDEGCSWCQSRPQPVAA